MAVAANKRATPKSMSGSIEEIPLPDLIQLPLDQPQVGRPHGALLTRRSAGCTSAVKGQIYFANLESNAAVGARKAIVRMLSWAHGSFELEPPDEAPVLEELEDSTEALLMDGMRQLDEYRVQLDKLPRCRPR